MIEDYICQMKATRQLGVVVGAIIVCIISEKSSYCYLMMIVAKTICE